jgi:hypothetical protein
VAIILRSKRIGNPTGYAEVSTVASPLSKALLSVGQDKMAGSEGPFRAWEGARQGDFLAKIRRISPSGQQRARQAPGGCSPRYALIEIVLWLRRSNGIARKALFIDRFYPRNLAHFWPLARVVAGFMAFLFFHDVAMHMK